MSDSLIDQIIKSRKIGLTYKQIGKIVHLSHERVRQIEIIYKQKCFYKKKHPLIIKKIKSENGSKIYWPIDEFVLYLGFEKVDNTLILNLQRYCFGEINFNNFLDIFLPRDVNLKGTLRSNIPAIRFRNIGIKKHSAVVNRLISLDFGNKLNCEIKERTLQIVRYFKSKNLPIYINVKGL